MVYEKKCAQCGKIIDFGGKDSGRLPDNAIEFDGSIYCKECVKKFVEFGTGEFVERINDLEDAMKKVKDELGMERHV